MENQPQQNPSRSLSKILKILFIVVVSLGIIALSVLVGIQIGRNQAEYSPRISTQPTIIPTQVTTIPSITPPQQNNSSTFDVSLDINLWKTFTNSSLGFSFKYPSEWGDVKEEIRDAKTDGSGDSGKTYSLTFTKISYEPHDLDYLPFGSGKSADFSAGRGGWDTDYSGNPKQPKGVYATVWAQPINCFIPTSSSLYFGRIDFNLPGKEISGVRLLMPVVTQNQIETIDTEYDSLTAEEQENYCTENNVEKEANEYIEELESKQLDDLSKKQLSVFKQMLSSSKVL